MESAERDLVKRAVAGDAEAMHRLTDAHAPHLFKIAYALTGRVADAEDLVQETLLAAIGALGRFEGRSSVRTWLVGIMARQAGNNRRKAARKLPPAKETGGPGESKVDARLDVAAALAELSPEYRDVLVLRELEGMSYEEIAAALDVPRGTVESRLYRARQEIRLGLKDYQDGS